MDSEYVLGHIKPTDAVVVVRIGIHFWPGLEFLQIAQGRGFFEDEGVNVELLRFTSLADEQRAYENGTVDGAYMNLDPVIVVNDRNGPAKLILVGHISKGGEDLGNGVI